MNAATLRPQTIQAWQRYIQTVNRRMAKRLEPSGQFLWIDGDPERRREVRNGAILVVPAHRHNPVSVPNGLIHDWIGAVFLPHASLQDVLSVIEDYSRYKTVYSPQVVASTPLGHVGNEILFSMILVNRSLFAESALAVNGRQYAFKIGNRRWYAISYSTRVREVEQFESESEHYLPVGQGKGYVWRLFGISRVEERDGGAYIELEAVALSRSIPVSVRWIVNPIVRRVARGAIVTSLEQTKRAVLRTRRARSPNVLANLRR